MSLVLPHRRLMLSGATAAAVPSSLAATLLGSETQGLAIDFTDSFWLSTTSLYGSAKVIDTGTPANNFNSTPYSLLTYTSPSPKMCLQADGTLKFGAHNLVTFSEQLDNAAWTKSQTTVTANAGVAPDGTTTADKIVENSGNFYHYAANSNATVVSGNTYSASIALKASGRSNVYVAMRAGGSGGYFDLQNGVIGGVSAGATDTYVSHSITSLDNGWYRCTIVVTATSTTGGVLVTLNDVLGGGSYQGDGASGVLAWGAHFRQTPSVSTYLATTSAARYSLPYEWNTSAVLQGILVEEARTNSYTYSQDPSNGAWGIFALTAGSAQTAPDGTATSYSILETTANSLHQFYRNTGVSYTSGTTYTISWYAKANGRTRIQTNIQSTIIVSSPKAFYDLSGAGSVDNVDAGCSATITALSNGYYRCTYTFTAALNAAGKFYMNTVSTGTTTSFVGDVTKGVYLWGFQSEAGSFATSYIPTTSATVTRAADDISLATSAFPSTATAGTIYGKANKSNTAAGYYVSLDDTTASNRIELAYRSSNTFIGEIVTGNAQQAQFDVTVSQGVRAMAMAFASNDSAFCYNGGTVLTDASVTLPTTTKLNLGSARNVTYLNGYLTQVMVLPTRKTNAYLQSVTT